MDEEVSEIIFKLINKNTLAIFDDVQRKPSKVKSREEYFYNNEVYYLVDHRNKSYPLIRDCLKFTNAFWHALCDITDTNCEDLKSNYLNLEIIKQICQQAKLVIIGAYDSEGYIFWEK